MSLSFTAAFNLIFSNIIPNLLRLLHYKFRDQMVSENSGIIMMVRIVVGMFTCTQTQFM